MTIIKTNQPPKPGARPAPTRRPLPIRSSKLAKRGRSVLYIGKNATGKTLRALSWPGPLILQFDPERETADNYETELPIIEVSDWSTWEQLILPVLGSRQRTQEAIADFGFPDYQVQTVVVDSYTGLDQMCETEMRKREPTNNQRMYGEKLLALRETQRILSALTQLSEDTAPWNLVGCVHEQVDMTTIEVNGKFKEVTDDIRASISGRFGKHFFGHWGTILWCMVDVPTTRDGELIRGKSANYYCRTDPIDQWRRGVDRAGKLPAKVAGDYADLMSYWSADDATSPPSANSTNA